MTEYLVAKTGNAGRGLIYKIEDRGIFFLDDDDTWRRSVSYEDRGEIIKYKECFRDLTEREIAFVVTLRIKGTISEDS